MIKPAAIAGAIFALLYIAFAQQSYAGLPIDWPGIWWSAGKVFMFVFAVSVFIGVVFGGSGVR